MIEILALLGMLFTGTFGALMLVANVSSVIDPRSNPSIPQLLWVSALSGASLTVSWTLWEWFVR